MFNNGDKWISYYDRNYWKLELAVTVIDRSKKLSFAGINSNDYMDWLRILFKDC